MTGLLDIQQHPMFDTPAWSPLAPMSIPQTGQVPRSPVPGIPATESPQYQEGSALESGLGLAGAGLLANNLLGDGLLGGIPSPSGLFSGFAPGALETGGNTFGAGFGGFGAGFNPALGMAGITALHTAQKYLHPKANMSFANFGMENGQVSPNYPVRPDVRNPQGQAQQYASQIANEMNSRSGVDWGSVLNSPRNPSMYMEGNDLFINTAGRAREFGDQGTMRVGPPDLTPVSNAQEFVSQLLNPQGAIPQGGGVIPEGYLQRVFKPGENEVLARTSSGRH